MTKKELKKLKQGLNSVKSLEEKKQIVKEVCKISKIKNPCISDDDYIKGFEEIKGVFECLI